MDERGGLEADAAIHKLEAEIVNRREITTLKGEAYELQRRTWEKQLQPKKTRKKKATAKETKKDREEL